jgi:hypothetical protein
VGIEEIFRARGVGFSADAGSGCGVDVPRFPSCEFTLVSGVDLKVSFVENIRVSRFVVDDFSVAASGVGRDAAQNVTQHVHLAQWFAMPHLARPFCLGRDAGVPVAEEIGEAV